MVNTASDVKLNALSNALSSDPFAPLLSSEIALKVCPDFYCSPVTRKILFAHKFADTRTCATSILCTRGLVISFAWV